MPATRSAPAPSPTRTKMSSADSANREGTLASTPHFNSPPPAPRTGRDRSSSRRRLTTSLGNLLGKRSDSSTSSVGVSTPTTDGLNGAAAAAAPRRGSLSSRRPSSEATSAAPSTNPSSTSASRSKPPVSLPSFFRRRLSSSSSAVGTDAPPTPSSPPSTSLDAGARRPSFDIGRTHNRSTSEDSTDYSQAPNVSQLMGERTDSGTTASSRGAPTSSSSRGGMSPASAVTSQSSYMRRDSQGSALSEDGRTRSPDAEEQEESMSSGSDEGEAEDIRDFVRASGGSSVSPHATPASPFSTHSRLSAVSDDAVPNLESPPSEEASSRPISPPPIQARRLTASNLALPNFSRAGSSAPAPPPASSNVDSSAASTSRPHSNSFTERRLRTLPRLLSNDAYNFAALTQPSASVPAAFVVPEGDEVGTGESETETETETEDEEEPSASSPGAAIPRSSNLEASTSTLTRTAPTNPTTPRALGLGVTAPTPAAPPSWVTFDPVTPTPGHVRTARIADGPGPSDSYFDIPRPLGSTSTSARTPGAPLMTPLLPQSLSNVARGQRPTRQDEAERTRTPATTPGRGALVVPIVERPPTTNLSVDGAELGSPTYRRRANSAVALMSPSLLDSDEEPVGTAALELDPVWQTGGLATPGPSFLSPALSVAPPETKKLQAPSSPVQARPSTAASRLHRPRSMYELHVAPPAYHSVYERAGFGPNQIVFPREEEGKEGLPDYTCAIHIEGYMPRKMEFTAPSVQAKDRAWKRQYVVLHGTSIKFYKYDLKTHPIAGEEDWANASPEMAGRDGPPPLHFHAGEYGVDYTAPPSKFPTSIHDARAKAKSRIVQATTASDTNLLLRHYSLQNAESGLAADYIKRKHVVRVRAEGEQFLLQTSGDRGTIDLIEVLQAATNVALDLDTRPLPKFITLPRRRRRRRRPDGAAAGASGTTAASTTGAAGGAEGANGASQAAAEEPDRMGDMLAEEQNAYSSARGTASAV